MVSVPAEWVIVLVKSGDPLSPTSTSLTADSGVAVIVAVPPLFKMARSPEPGGCIPDQKPQFTCSKEGTQDACTAGSICIHHSCYIACSVDAGASACKNADKFNICKSVTTGSGSYSVCGSAGNLGTDCDPTQNKNCPGAGVCIDGFCR